MFSLKPCFLADYIGTSRFFLQFAEIFQEEEEEEKEDEEEKEEEEEVTRSLILKEHVAIIVPYRNPTSSIVVFIKNILSHNFTL